MALTTITGKGINNVTLDSSGNITAPSFIGDSGLGLGQSYSSPSRTAGVTYTNSTGKSIFVFVSADSVNDLKGFVDDIECAYAYDGAGGNRAEVSFIVPNGSTYEATVATGSINDWYELR